MCTRGVCVVGYSCVWQDQISRDVFAARDEG